jgi:aminoglycoside 6'-N-acetyltransferase I
MDVQIREVRAGEGEAWLGLRERLWPQSSREDLSREREEIAADPRRNGVLVAVTGGELVGFVEVSIRDWAEGCVTRGVGYIEGWYVSPEHQRRGIGRRLIEAAEGWARSRDCTEMGSDADLDNVVSHQAHKALGYREVGPIMLFSKRLGA